MNVRKFVAVSACTASLSFASLAGAQQGEKNAAPQVKVQVQPGQNGQRSHSQNTDQKLATCIAIGNQEEIAIAKFAEEKAKSKDVKEFARMLVKDHQSFLQKLQQYAPEASREGYLDNAVATNETQRSSAAPQKSNAAGVIQQTSATQEADSQHLDFLQLHREIAEECIRSSKQNLSKKEGKEFDECFIGHQIAKHAEMKTKLVVFERHVTGELKQLLADGVETTEKHMKKAESIMKSLADSSSRDSK